MWAFICGLTGGLLADSTGRRKLFLVSTAGMLLAFVLQTICSAEFAIHKTKGIGTVVVVWICAYRIFCSYYLCIHHDTRIVFYKGFYALAWNPIPLLYVTVIVPFSLRAKGHSIFSICRAASLVFNQYANPIALKAISWKYYVSWIHLKRMVLDDNTYYRSSTTSSSSLFLSSCTSSALRQRV